MADFLLPQCSGEFNKKHEMNSTREKTAIRHKIPKRFHLFLGSSGTLVEVWTYSSTCSSLFVAAYGRNEIQTGMGGGF